MNAHEEWLVEASGKSYTISTDPSRVDLDVVTDYLSGTSYWAKGRPAKVIEASVAQSIPFGVFSPEGAQAGFARLVTDNATFGWVCDVFVLDDHRGLGLGKSLLARVTEYADARGIGQLILATADAHGLYAQTDFNALTSPEKWMLRVHPKSPKRS